MSNLICSHPGPKPRANVRTRRVPNDADRRFFAARDSIMTRILESQMLATCAVAYEVEERHKLSQTASLFVDQTASCASEATNEDNPHTQQAVSDLVPSDDDRDPIDPQDDDPDLCFDVDKYLESNYFE